MTPYMGARRGGSKSVRLPPYRKSKKSMWEHLFSSSLWRGGGAFNHVGGDFSLYYGILFGFVPPLQKLLRARMTPLHKLYPRPQHCYITQFTVITPYYTILPSTNSTVEHTATRRLHYVSFAS